MKIARRIYHLRRYPVTLGLYRRVCQAILGKEYVWQFFVVIPFATQIHRRFLLLCLQLGSSQCGPEWLNCHNFMVAECFRCMAIRNSYGRCHSYQAAYHGSALIQIGELSSWGPSGKILLWKYKTLIKENRFASSTWFAYNYLHLSNQKQFLHKKEKKKKKKVTFFLCTFWHLWWFFFEIKYLVLNRLYLNGIFKKNYIYFINFTVSCFLAYFQL